MRFALVVSQYHAFVTDGLERGARQVLAEAGVDEHAIERFLVPGAFEVPQAAARAATTGRFNAIICLGCLIRGETPHFEYIAQAAAAGLMRAAQETGVPMTFGILTTNTADEALARAGDGPANKGREAATAAVEMAELYGRIEGGA